jgi:hypothetical protein
MWFRRWWKVWDTEKFVPTDFLTCWWRSTKFSFPPHQSFLTTTGKACCHSMVTGDESWFPSLWSRNNMTEQGMPSHIAQEKEAKNNALSGQCFWGCWRMHTNWVFVTRGNHQCCFLHSHTQNLDCALHDKCPGKEKDSTATRQYTAPNCSSVRAEDSNGWKHLPHPPYSPDLDPVDNHGFVTDQMRA